jgi:epoxyqueuosine reductase
VEFSCKELGIELLEGPYDLETWLKLTKGLENEPEKGDRCTLCFDNRLEVSVQKALELGHNKFTTTLLISPKKSQEKLEIIGQELEKRYNCQFIFKDYRSGNGMEQQRKEVKDNNLYRQNYCGCLYGLNAQRDQQQKLADELMLPIGRQIQPESIEERLELYKKRDQNKDIEIVKQRFLNYRLLSAKVYSKQEVFPSYFLCYSSLKNNRTNGRVEKQIGEIYYFNRDEVKFIPLEYFNFLLNSEYKNIYELIYNPPLFNEELELRNKLTNNPYDLSTIVVLNKIPKEKLFIECTSQTFEDVREVIF